MLFYTFLLKKSVYKSKHQNNSEKVFSFYSHIIKLADARSNDEKISTEPHKGTQRDPLGKSCVNKSVVSLVYVIAIGSSRTLTNLTLLIRVRAGGLDAAISIVCRRRLHRRAQVRESKAALSLSLWAAKLGRGHKSSVGVHYPH